jgi:toxin ParE1/3/4
MAAREGRGLAGRHPPAAAARRGHGRGAEDHRRSESPLNLIWRQSARSDLRAIVTYIAERNAPAAQQIKDAIEACAERLSEHPFLYRRGRLAGTREAVVHPNYVLIYTVGAEGVEILNVVHARQQYP